ncbi:mRNA 3'-end-processing protein rna14, partial [Ascosphaera acerosa]
KLREAAKKAETAAIKQEHGPRLAELSKLISYTWIALMRSMRRIQGKGKPGENAGSRQVFAEARKRGRITSDVYIASALMEHHCYKDPAATKIFERGSKLFPDDAHFALHYLRHLIEINDITNARAVFETATRRLTAAREPELVRRARPLFRFMHEHESRYGDLGQIMSIEARMRELYPDDPALAAGRFAARFADDEFDPTAVRLVLSPTQARMVARGQADGDTAPSVVELDGPPGTGAGTSPKRARPAEYESADELARPRKHARAESPARLWSARAFSNTTGTAGRDSS